MMFIDQGEISVDQSWLTRAKSALEETEAAGSETARMGVIESKSKVWKAAARELRKPSHGKCWYSEAPRSGSRQDVDHYRPKGAINGSTHGGYWWLAFDWKNFRLSCQICNQYSNNPDDGKGGKGDQFPVEDEAGRITFDNRRLPSVEVPMLLDPCNKVDVSLLWFEEDGQPRPTMPDASKLSHKRASISISIYNLKSPSLVTGRATQLNMAKVLLAQGMAAFDAIDGGNVTQLTALSNAIVGLKALQKREQPYTRAIRCFLMAKRSEIHPWIESAIVAD